MHRSFDHRPPLSVNDAACDNAARRERKIKSVHRLASGQCHNQTSHPKAGGYGTSALPDARPANDDKRVCDRHHLEATLGYIGQTVIALLISDCSEEGDIMKRVSQKVLKLFGR